MFNNRFYYLAILVFFSGFSIAKDVGADSSATNLNCSQDDSGRYRITGTVVDSNGRAACGLAMASGKCVFTCGPGSLRCEGGTDNLSFGQFDLAGLPTEPNGMINLQTFVSGILPGLQVLNPTNCSSSDITPGLYAGVTSQGNGCSILGEVHPNDSCEVRLNIKSIDGVRVALSPSTDVDFVNSTINGECGGSGIGDPVSFMAIAHCPIGSCAGGQCPVLFYICSTIELSNGSFNYAGIIHGNCTDNACSGTINGGASCSFSWTATLK